MPRVVCSIINVGTRRGYQLIVDGGQLNQMTNNLMEELAAACRNRPENTIPILQLQNLRLASNNNVIFVIEILMMFLTRNNHVNTLIISDLDAGAIERVFAKLAGTHINYLVLDKLSDAQMQIIFDAVSRMPRRMRIACGTSISPIWAPRFHAAHAATSAVAKMQAPPAASKQDFFDALHEKALGNSSQLAQPLASSANSSSSSTVNLATAAATQSEKHKQPMSTGLAASEPEKFLIETCFRPVPQRAASASAASAIAAERVFSEQEIRATLFKSVPQNAAEAPRAASADSSKFSESDCISSIQRSLVYFTVPLNHASAATHISATAVSPARRPPAFVNNSVPQPPVPTDVSFKQGAFNQWPASILPPRGNSAPKESSAASAVAPPAAAAAKSTTSTRSSRPARPAAILAPRRYSASSSSSTSSSSSSSKAQEQMPTPPTTTRVKREILVPLHLPAPLPPLSKAFMDEAADILRGNSRAQSNCAPLCIGLLKTIKKRELPQKTVAPRPGTYEDATIHDLPEPSAATAAVSTSSSSSNSVTAIRVKKEPDAKDDKVCAPKASLITELFKDAFPCEDYFYENEQGQICLAEQIDLTTHLRDLESVDHSQLDARLSQEANPNETLVGTIFLTYANRGPGDKYAGHFIVFYKAPQQPVLLIDCQLAKRTGRVFTELASRYSFTGPGPHFSSTCYFIIHDRIPTLMVEAMQATTPRTAPQKKRRRLESVDAAVTGAAATAASSTPTSGVLGDRSTNSNAVCGSGLVGRTSTTPNHLSMLFKNLALTDDESDLDETVSTTESTNSSPQFS